LDPLLRMRSLLRGPTFDKVGSSGLDKNQ
jgi:hypothetical protein